MFFRGFLHFLRIFHGVLTKIMKNTLFQADTSHSNVIIVQNWQACKRLELTPLPDQDFDGMDIVLFLFNPYKVSVFRYIEVYLHISIFHASALRSHDVCGVPA